jgi:cyclic pyranopterin phosphate synthase
VNASAVVITISTGIAAGQRADSSGGTLRAGLAQLGLTLSDSSVIRDDRLKIQQAVLRNCDFEPVSLLVFTGGTGPTPDDVTPEAILPLLDRRYEGIENAIHDDGRSSTPRAPMSRLVAGARGRTVIIALPGSPSACADALTTLAPVLTHLLSLTAGTFDPH